MSFFLFLAGALKKSGILPELAESGIDSAHVIRDHGNIMQSECYE